MYKHKFIVHKEILFSVIILFVSHMTLFAKVDPNHECTGGYGYLVEKGKKATVWWAEGIYKVMKDAPTPQIVQKTVNLNCAGNEWESFIVCLKPNQYIKGLDFKILPFKNVGSDAILECKSEIRKVEYVNVYVPTDEYGKEGLWPDPMPLFEKEDIRAEEGLRPYWFSIKLPKDAPAGDYYSSLVIKPLNLRIPIKLHVWDFSLPDSPTLKSMFGFNINSFIQYDHLETDAEIDYVFEEHMSAFRDFKISPYFPFERTPMKINVKGVDWKGGCFDGIEKHSGKYSYRVSDYSRSKLVEGITTEKHPIGENRKLKISFWARTSGNEQAIAAGIECYRKDGSLVTYGPRFGYFTAGREWTQFSFETTELAEGSDLFEFHVSPCKRSLNGESEGVVWFDDIEVLDSKGNNIFPCGNFETDIETMNVELDFTEMAPAAEKYFGEYGFNAFNLRVKGLGGGTFYSRVSGNFEGFDQGTPEFEKLFGKYMKSLDEGLAKLGIADKACVYWFDEPSDWDYGFIYETNAMIKKYSPHLKPFLTENTAGHDISEVTDYSCTIWHLLNHDKIRRMKSKGMENWSYLCCYPRSPWITEFIDHDAVNLRMWCIASYKHNLDGILIWDTSYWNSVDASPQGRLHNPWEDGMSWAHGYGASYRELISWGNGDGRLFYPQNRDPNNGSTETLKGRYIPSIRLEFLRDGIEEFEYFKLYENLKGEKLEIPESLYKDEKTYNKNPLDALNFRNHVAQMIEQMKD